ncbi:MAG: CehA/McbA family metallohydrolase, partial [Candidatus Binatia bacterium]
LHAGQMPIFVQQDEASKSYTPGPIEAGIWHVELGIAAVGPVGATWEVEITCRDDVAIAPPPAPDPVDPLHVARDEPGWYHGDFHMHGFHSNPGAADPLDPDDGFVAQALAAGLDFLMITEYVVGRHWDELGHVQEAKPDLLIWPGREVITYFGHVNVHGETPEVLEYRHGFEDVHIKKDIQVPVNTLHPEALFQVNHPTIFPGPVFQNFCRGCEFTLRDEIDWDLVDTIEVVTGPTVARSTDIGLPALPGQIQNPFIQTAIDLWEDLLMEGHKITAVSGSDSKGVDAPAERPRVGYGSSATAVYAEKLSRAALTAAIRAGHAYVRTRGVAASPELGFEVTTKDGQSGTFGDAVMADAAKLRVGVTGGAGQVLRYVANGLPVFHVPILSDDFTHELPATRLFPEGPLGTFWRIETLDQDALTAIGNPVFLRGE